MGATSSSLVLGPGDVFYSVNFTNPAGGPAVPLNYSSPATPYYELAYRNFTELSGFQGSTVCPGVCVGNGYEYGTFFNAALFGVDTINTTASSFDFYSFDFGCGPVARPTSGGGDNRNDEYAGTANCTLTFSGYAAGAEYGFAPVAQYSHHYVPQNSPSPFTSLPIAQADNVTLPATFKNLKYVALSATIDQSTIDEIAAENFTVVGAKVLIGQSQYIAHHLVHN